MFFKENMLGRRKQIEQLLADLESKFQADYDESHERKDVQKILKGLPSMAI